jgi:hypothetical protein
MPPHRDHHPSPHHIGGQLREMRWYPISRGIFAPVCLSSTVEFPLVDLSIAFGAIIVAGPEHVESHQSLPACSSVFFPSSLDPQLGAPLSPYPSLMPGAYEHTKQGTGTSLQIGSCKTSVYIDPAVCFPNDPKAAVKFPMNLFLW